MTSELRITIDGSVAEQGRADYMSHMVIRYQRSLTKQAFCVTRDWHTAEDVVQDAFMDLNDALATNGNIKNVGAWLKRVTYRIAIEYVRKSIRQRDAHSLAVDSREEVRCPVSAFERTELEDKVKSMIPMLPEQQALTIYMRHIEELNCEQIAWRLACDPSTVRTAYQQGMSRLRSLVMACPA